MQIMSAARQGNAQVKTFSARDGISYAQVILGTDTLKTGALITVLMP